MKRFFLVALIVLAVVGILRAGSCLELIEAKHTFLSEVRTYNSNELGDAVDYLINKSSPYVSDESLGSQRERLRQFRESDRPRNSCSLILYQVVDDMEKYAMSAISREGGNQSNRDMTKGRLSKTPYELVRSVHGVISRLELFEIRIYDLEDLEEVARKRQEFKELKEKLDKLLEREG